MAEEQAEWHKVAAAVAHEKQKIKQVKEKERDGLAI